VTSFLKFKFFWIGLVCATLLASFFGCSYKPSYLQKSTRTPVAERWKVEKIDPAKLSPEEASVFEKRGSPQYVRFFRKLDPDRERVYEWIYTDPIRLISFIDGKQVDYVVVDEDPSPLNDYQRKWLFWSSVAAATAGGLGLVYYYLFGR